MSDIDLELLGFFCDEATDLLTRWEALSMELEKSADTGKIDELFRLAHNLKGSSRSVGLQSFGNAIHKIEDGITLLKSGKVKFSGDVTLVLLKAQAFFQEWINEARNNPAAEKDPTALYAEYDRIMSGTAEVAAEHDETPIETYVENSVQAEEPVAQTAAVIPIKKETVQAPPPPAQKPSPTAGDETVRVSARKIEVLIEMMGELSIHQSVVFHGLQNANQSRSPQVIHSAYLGRKLTRELYEKTLALRMVPVQPVFQRLERTIKEMARTLGKEVEVEVSGGEVELDKTVCEKIVEPLTHMVRNSIDHGIESVEDRLKAGKPRAGKVKLKAVQDSGSVGLFIEDDGKGLNSEKILAKALSQGVITEQSKLDPMEVYALIFLPGFSTAEKVTDVSGRGVGMDVVMKTVESLRGDIKIGSELGKGTNFQITLPTTLSIIDALVIKVKDSIYAVPVSAIDEIVNVHDISIGRQDKMLQIGSHVIPVEDLSVTLRMRNQVDYEANAILVVRMGKQRIGFRVDEICEQQQLVVRKFAPGMANVFGLAGATILANGQPGLIVDLQFIAEHFLSQFTYQPMQEKAA